MNEPAHRFGASTAGTPSPTPPIEPPMLAASPDARAWRDARQWSARLAEEASLFACLAPGSRIGLVAESLLAPGAPRAESVLVWAREAAGMTVRAEPYPGFEAVDVDLLIALDPVADAALAGDGEGGWLRTIRRLLRDGHVLFFARRPRAALEDAGYDDLLYELGFAYLGACR